MNKIQFPQSGGEQNGKRITGDNLKPRQHKKPNLPDELSKKPQNKDLIKDSSDAIEKLLGGEIDIKTALGFIKSTTENIVYDEPDKDLQDPTKLTEDFFAGKISGEEYRNALKNIKNDDIQYDD